jgi:5-methylcytosine-specific restriction protein B
MQQKIDILKYKKQIILQGPPGTGKTKEMENTN